MLPLYLSTTLAQSQSTLFISLSVFMMMCCTVSFCALSSTVAPVCFKVIMLCLRMHKLARSTLWQRNSIEFAFNSVMLEPLFHFFITSTAYIILHQAALLDISWDYEDVLAGGMMDLLRLDIWRKKGLRRLGV